jgi:hypothetical protein
MGEEVRGQLTPTKWSLPSAHRVQAILCPIRLLITTIVPFDKIISRHGTKMASTANLFAALTSIGSGQAPAGAGKKKKAKKPKQPQQGENGSDPSANGSSRTEGVAAAGQDAVVEVGAACAILDKAARTFKSGNDRLKLWKDWVKQVR